MKSGAGTNADSGAESIAKRRLVTGVVWYTPKEWARVKAIAVDPENFEASYEAWAVNVAEGMRPLSRTYGDVRPVNITAEELLDWCAEHGREVDSQARVEYMMTLVRLQQDAVHAAAAGTGLVSAHPPLATSSFSSHEAEPAEASG